MANIPRCRFATHIEMSTNLLLFEVIYCLTPISIELIVYHWIVTCSRNNNNNTRTHIWLMMCVFAVPAVYFYWCGFFRVADAFFVSHAFASLPCLEFRLFLADSASVTHLAISAIAESHKIACLMANKEMENNMQRNDQSRTAFVLHASDDDVHFRFLFGSGKRLSFQCRVFSFSFEYIGRKMRKLIAHFANEILCVRILSFLATAQFWECFHLWQK